MALSDLKFIFYFLPAVLAVYAVIRPDLRSLVLIISGLWFYYMGAGPAGLLIFVGSVLLNYFAAGGIARWDGWKKKLLLALILIFDFGTLFAFKYAGYFASLILPGSEIAAALSGLIIPLGISFYTFTLASFVIDTYRGQIPADVKPGKAATGESGKATAEPLKQIPAAGGFRSFAAFVTFFPKLISGPIVRYGQMQPGLAEPKTTRENLEDGFAVFVIGLGMKILIADGLAPQWQYIQRIGYENISTTLAWIGAFGYSLQLYFDFHGYSLMAMGIGKMFGFDLPLNFDLPYLSLSVSEFWRRWHITLGSWFRDYLYIPLGGSKNGKWRMVLSLTVVWLFTGLWHGVGLNFILWGICLLVLILLEKFVFKKFFENHPALGHLYVCFVIPQTWVIFAIPDLKDIGYYFSRLYPDICSLFGRMNAGICNLIGRLSPDVYNRLGLQNLTFGGVSEFVNELDFVEVVNSNWWVAFAGIFLCLPFFRRWFTKRGKGVVMTVFLLAVFWVSVYVISRQGSNPFMYFNF